MDIKCVICEDVVGTDTSSKSGIPFGEKGKYICSSCMNGIKAVMNQLGPTRREEEMMNKKIDKLAKETAKILEAHNKAIEQLR